MSKNPNSIDVLAQSGANILLRNNDGKTVLDIAIEQKQCEITKALISVVKEAITLNKQIAYYFTKFMPFPEPKDEDKLKILSASYYFQDPEEDFMINFEENLEQNIKKFYKICIQKQEQPPVEVKSSNSILEQYADFYKAKKDRLDFVNAKASTGDTPMHVAAKFGNVNVVESFVEHGATFLLKNNDNKTALNVALDNNQCKFAKLIIPMVRENIYQNNHIRELIYQQNTDQSTSLDNSIKEDSLIIYFQNPEGDFMIDFEKDFNNDLQRYVEICGETL